MAPKHSAEALSSVPEYKKDYDVPYGENVLDKLHSGMSYCAVDCKFNVNESTVCHNQKKNVEICQSVHEPIQESTKVISIVCNKVIERVEKRFNRWIHEIKNRFFF